MNVAVWLVAFAVAVGVGFLLAVGLLWGLIEFIKSLWNMPTPNQ